MLHMSSSDNLRLGVDSWIARLPTPSLDPVNSSLMTPSLSRTSSLASLRSSEAVEKYGDLRPLPSPCPDHAPRPSSSSNESEQSPTSASKTHAFFSAPFSIAIARKAPTDSPPAATRAASLTLPPRKGPRNDLQLTPSISYERLDDPSAEPIPITDSSNQTTPDARGSPPRSQTANSSFFGPSRIASLDSPKPPPNLEPIITQKKSGFTSLSRFFPSRNRSSDPDIHTAKVNITEPTPTSAIGEEAPSPVPRPPSPAESSRRSFVEIRPERERASLDDEAWCASPTTSTSGPLLQVPSPTRPRQASPERLLAHAHWAQKAQRHQRTPSSSDKAPTETTSTGYTPLRRETDQHKRFPVPTPDPMSGQVIGAPHTPLKLIKLLGQGAFSSVWLATDETAELALTRSASIDRGLNRQGSAGKRVVRRRRPSESWAKKQSDKQVGGLKPLTESATDTPRTSLEGQEYRSLPPQSQEMSLSRSLSKKSLKAHAFDGRPTGEQRVVAVKMMDRAMCDANDRTRISFVREVEILRASYVFSSVFLSLTSVTRSIFPIPQLSPTYIPFQLKHITASSWNMSQAESSLIS